MDCVLDGATLKLFARRRCRGGVGECGISLFVDVVDDEEGIAPVTLAPLIPPMTPPPIPPAEAAPPPPPLLPMRLLLLIFTAPAINASPLR